MPFQFHEDADPTALSNIGYGFFTNEDGTSDGDYVVVGQNTRNVNIFSPSQLDDSKTPKPGYDSAVKVGENINRCFNELLAGRDGVQHKLFMTTNYAKDGLKIRVCENFQGISALKEDAKVNLESVGPDMAEKLTQLDISIIKADAIIVKGIAGHQIAVGGASGDAHPVIIYDDQNKIACYFSAAHVCIKAGVIEESLSRMLSLGANIENIRLIIGPGLGPNSYEFGANAAAYLDVPTDNQLRRTDLQPTLNQ